MLRCLIPLFAAGALAAAGPETLVDNDQVRVVRVTDQPHVKGAPHQHQFNRVMIFLQAGRQEIVSADGKKTILEWKPGEVKWSPASGTHTSEVVSNDPVTIVEIELKNPGDPAKTATSAMDPLKVAPRQAKLEFENPQVRVFRAKIAPHATLPMHEHVLNKVSVTLTDQNERVTTADGKSDLVKHPAGFASWSGPVKHVEESLSDRPTEVLVIEVKE